MIVNRISYIFLFYVNTLSAAEIKKIDDGLFVSQTNDGLIFALEKIGDNNFETWDEFFADNLKAIDNAEKVKIGTS